MSEQNSMMNIGDLAKPVTVLIEKISDATGAALAPWQIKRVAKAEAEANKIKALSEVEINDIKERIKDRLTTEEVIKQLNIESVVAKALPEVKEDAEPKKIDNDWLLKTLPLERREILWSDYGS